MARRVTYIEAQTRHKLGLVRIVLPLGSTKTSPTMIKWLQRSTRERVDEKTIKRN